jgi:hypothetical protein
LETGRRTDFGVNRQAVSFDIAPLVQDYSSQVSALKKDANLGSQLGHPTGDKRH